MPGMQVPIRAQRGRARSALFSRVNIRNEQGCTHELECIRIQEYINGILTSRKWEIGFV